MKLPTQKHARMKVDKLLFISIPAALVFLLAGCNGGDDGDEANEVNLPTDTVLTLFCPDVGLSGEKCILDDPENPFANSNVNDETKFDLAGDLPSAKAAFYMWGTALALSPSGENQYYTALSLHELFTQGGSELARQQALRAYRSALDHYFNSVTFFKQETPFGDTFYPASVRQLIGDNIYSPDDMNLAPLFDLDNQLYALETFGEWGYTYDVDTGEITRNY